MSSSSSQTIHASVKRASLKKSCKKTAKSNSTMVTDDFTDGSASSTLRQSDSSPANKKDYTSWRIAAYLTEPNNPNPGYRYTIPEDSIRNHTTIMKSYLDEMDQHIFNLKTTTQTEDGMGRKGT